MNQAPTCGLVFYRLAKGDHPAVAAGGQVRGRVGFDAEEATVAEVRSKICERHNIQPSRFRVDLTGKTTGEPLDDDAPIRSYDEVDVAVFRITLNDVVAAQKKAASRPSTAVQLDSSLLLDQTLAQHAFDGGKVGGGENKDPQQTQRMLVIANYPRLPLSIVASTDLHSSSCVLCRLPSVESKRTACCSQTACDFCIAYAKSLLSDDRLCPVCGSGGSPPKTPVRSEPSVIKSESTAAVKKASQPLMLGLLPAPLAEVPSDDDDESDPLYTMLDTPPWKKSRIEAH